MTRKDSEKESERPHYYSQFWLDIAAGRRVIGGPRPDENGEAAEAEAEAEEEEEFFDDDLEEVEEEEEDWTPGRGRKKPKPGRQVKPPKKPRRETRRGF